MLVGTAPGGSPDVVGRMLAEQLGDRIGSAVYVENVTQAAGAVSYRMVARAAPDGGTLGILTSGYAPEVTLRPDSSYDPVDGLRLVTMLCSYPMVYAVPANSPIASCRSAGARQTDPGKLTYTITGYGSAYHILTKWIELEDPRRIADRGALSGHRRRRRRCALRPRRRTGRCLDLGPTAHQVRSVPRAGAVIAAALRAVAGCANEFGDLAQGGIHVVAVPRGASSNAAALTDKLNADVKTIIAAPDFTRRLADLGSVPAPTAPDETRRMVADAIVRWADVIKRGNIKVD